MRKKLSLSQKILIGLGSGVITGLLFGSFAGYLTLVGDAFIGLLQMTVLPYIIFSIISNIGRLSPNEGQSLIRNGIKILFLLLGIGFVFLLLLPLALPLWDSATFYSPSFVDSPPPIDYLALYIPSNPFNAMSASMVPAVVVFSIFLGLGLRQIDAKQTLLKLMDTISAALNQVNKIVIKITPIGVFAIAASTTGTLGLEDLGKMQGFLIIYAIGVFILTFWLLPRIITACTPFSYGDIFKYSKSTLLTIFATGKIIVVLPQLIEDIKELYKAYKLDTTSNKATTDILMPLAYPFPNLGTLVIFVFVPFAAWFVGLNFSGSDTFTFLSATLMSSFIAPVTGIPFMLDLLGINKDLFQLFVVSTVLTDRIRVVLGAMHLITFSILTVFATRKILKVKWPQLGMTLLVTVGMFFALVFPAKKYLAYSLKDAYQFDQIIANMPLLGDPVESEIISVPKSNPKKLRNRETRLGRIKKRGVLRVGYYEEELPYTYMNKKGELVGFGIDMSHALARNLSVSLEFVPIESGKLISQMEADHFDMVVSDIFLSSAYSESMLLSAPYMDVTLALLAKNKKEELKTFKTASALDTFTVAFFERKEIADKFQSFFPNAQMVQISSLKEFFQPDSLVIDAFLTSAERGSALNLLHPDCSVLNPLPINIQVPLVFPIAGRDSEFERYVSAWIAEAGKDGTIDKFYNYWILGKDVKKKKRKWNLIQDVFHWLPLDYQS